MSGSNSCPSRTFLFLELPDTAEWDHMRFRAGMVKELTVPESDNYDALLEVIKLHKIDLTFPELVSLHIHILVSKRLQTSLPLFAPSRLQELEITFEGYNDRLIDSTMKTLLAQAHPLQSLDIRTETLPKPSQEYLVQLLETTPSINSLRLTLMTSHGEDIVQAAAQLPNLRTLRLQFTGPDGTGDTYPPGFQSLISLDIVSPYAIALGVVRAITSPNISTLNMDVLDGINGPPRNLVDAMSTMSSLSAVNLTFYRSPYPQWADVEPLLACPRISTFTITLASPGLEVDDEIISAISRAWPNLTHLRLDGFDATPKRFKRPSLRGLSELLGRCQKLQEVTLEVDARARQLRTPLANATSASSEPHRKLLLNVRRSRIAQNSEKVVSEYLMSLWPGQCKVASEWMDDEWQGATWDKVGALMTSMHLIWKIPQLRTHVPLVPEHEKSDILQSPVPNMHRIWNIPELLGLILSFLDEKSDILRCALVCRSLSVEAARLIWKEVSAFRYLLGCFPKNTISTEISGPPDHPSRKFLFLELPDTAEWEHMRFRASMVKELTFPRDDNYDPLLEVINRQETDLTFPELASLHLHVSVAKRFQTFLPLFAASRLQELEITFKGYNNRLINTAMETLLAQAHPLQSLDIEATSFPKLSQHYVIQLLATTSSINSLSISLGALDGEDIVQAAGSLPNLQYLSFDFGADTTARTAYSPGFHSLVTLDTSSTYAPALAILRAITSTDIAALNMHVWREINEQPTGLFQPIAAWTNVTFVSVTFYNSGILQWEEVEPLLSCPLISTFEIMIDSPGMEIDDEVISAISRAWPNLTRLKLAGSEETPAVYTRPSLHGLAELFGRCPKLQELTLEVDARITQSRLPLETPANSEGREKLFFDVRRSPIARKSEETVSEFLMSVWPGECEVISWWEEEQLQRAAWENVGELMRQRG
ncbi:hypothetical protein FS837_005479 [Tulasnella sp. UAMH 9824]|nr:hypothetical protein FS837_005479 [Tulasnella sp. UAMH 9824]